MSDLLRWFPSRTARWTSPFNTLLRSPSELMDSLDRLFESSTGPAPIRVEEFVDGKNLVVRAEVPGVDPDKDIEVTITDGFLRIHAQRQEKEEHKDKDKGLFRSEFRYGSFSRSIPLPKGITEEDIKATYTDGVLEVRAPLPEEAAQPQAPKKLPITRG
ncbi:MAG TPA: Hsp20/alpha crystallin family protein [Arthrobacter sp.]